MEELEYLEKEMTGTIVDAVLLARVSSATYQVTVRIYPTKPRSFYKGEDESFWVRHGTIYYFRFITTQSGTIELTVDGRRLGYYAIETKKENLFRQDCNDREFLFVAKNTPEGAELKPLENDANLGHLEFHYRPEMSLLNTLMASHSKSLVLAEQFYTKGWFEGAKERVSERIEATKAKLQVANISLPSLEGSRRFQTACKSLKDSLENLTTFVRRTNQRLETPFIGYDYQSKVTCIEGVHLTLKDVRSQILALEGIEVDIYLGETKLLDDNLLLPNKTIVKITPIPSTKPKPVWRSLPPMAPGAMVAAAASRSPPVYRSVTVLRSGGTVGGAARPTLHKSAILDLRGSFIPPKVSFHFFCIWSLEEAQIALGHSIVKDTLEDALKALNGGADKNSMGYLPSGRWTTKGSKTFSAITLAIRHGSMGMLEFLLQGKPSDLGNHWNGLTFCMDAVYGLREDSLLVLLAHNYDLNQADHIGRTPLHMACDYNLPSMVTLLLQKGSDPFLRDKLGYIPMMDAARQANLDCLKAFVQFGFPPKVQRKLFECVVDKGSDRGKGLVALVQYSARCREDINQTEAYLIQNGSGMPIPRKVEERNSTKNCVICWERKADRAIIPCGHLCLCQKCVEKNLEKCPLCRGKITLVQKIYQ